MRREKYEVALVEDNRPSINKDALEFNLEELQVEKKYVFHTNRESISIFKELEEPYIHVFLKAIAYHIYKPLYNTLQIDPPIYRKYKPDIMALDYTNEPLCWIECFERNYEKIEFICKHIHVDEFILVEISDDINPFIEEIKKRVHYKYHHLITIINFVPELIHYVDPEDIFIMDDWYHIINLS